MSAEIDTSNGRENVAWIGERPWHNLGQQLAPNQPLEVWAKEAGLDWKALRTAALYDTGVSGIKKSNRDVLYRSDTNHFLGVIGKHYKEVQPSEVLDFFTDLVEKFHFQMEVAGSLFGGKRIWALANTGAAEKLAGDKDDTKLYMLLATSFDGSLSTQARLTTVRVVCNNTLELAQSGSAKNVAKVWHSAQFDADHLKQELDIEGRWKNFVDTSAKLKKVEVSDAEVVNFLTKLYQIKPDSSKMVQERFLARMKAALFTAPGSDGSTNLWNVLNAVTFDIDHKNTRSHDSQMSNATFGWGCKMKIQALEELTEMALAA